MTTEALKKSGRKGTPNHPLEFQREIARLASSGLVLSHSRGQVKFVDHMTSMMAKTKTPSKTLPAGVGKVQKRLHYSLDVILLCGRRRYVAYSLNLRYLEEMMAERGIEVDHSSAHRWVIKPRQVFEQAFRKRKRPVGKSWRVDETFVKANGQWKYLYRAVDKAANTEDFLLRANREKAAARRHFEKAIEQRRTRKNYRGQERRQTGCA